MGMSALFPGAPDLDAFRANLHAGVDAITHAPASRWDKVFLDPRSSALDRFYGDRGGFVDDHARFEPLDYGVVPSTVREAEPDQLLLLKLASDAIADAGRTPADLPRHRTAVIVGRGGYITSGLARSAQRVREGEQLLAVLRQVLPHLGEAELGAVKQAWTASAGDLAADQAIGLVPNLVASRTANRLDLHGPAYTVDGACASALLAVDQAVTALRVGRIDAALAAGVHLTHDVTFWSIFCRLGAMSRKGQIRPFDADADGLLIGEGAGVVLLKRLDDALRDGDRIRAVIRGTGSASDGRGATLMSPSAAGQVLALERAWSDAQLDPATVGLIEAHGTATAAGDSSELETVRQVFGVLGPAVAVGSVKSMIGHTMPAAGMAGLIKATLALQDQTWLPSLHVQTPHRLLQGTRFVVPGTATPWTSEGPRRAGVNAFGFGGINAHVVLEEAPSAPRALRRPAAAPVFAVYAAADAEGLAAAVLADQRSTQGAARLALRDPTPNRRLAAAKVAAAGASVQGRQGTYAVPAPLGGTVAFLYPGIEEAMDGSVAALAEPFGLEVPSALRQAPAGLDDLGLRTTQVLATAGLLGGVLERLGVVPGVHLGHSVGEWSALVASGVIPRASLDGFIASLAGERLELPDVVFGALGCGLAEANALIAGRPDVVVSHDNCPHQTIVCGPEAAVSEVVAAAGRLSTVLPFRSGFHSKHFAPFAARFAPHIASVPLAAAQAAVWSSTRAGPWPATNTGVRELLGELLVAPVRFRETVLAAYAAGVRVFVQLGMGSLTNFVGDTLKGQPHLCVSLCEGRRSARDQLGEAAAALIAAGVSLDPRELPELRTGRGQRLRLGTPLLTMQDPPVLGEPSDTVDLPAGPIADALRASLTATRRAGRDVAAALTRPAPQPTAIPAPPLEERRTLRFGVDTHPYLADHALFQQPLHSTADTFPVVPMTMNLTLMTEAAQRLMPGSEVVGIVDVRAARWLAVSPPAEVEVVARRVDAHDVAVELVGYASGTVRFAATWPAAPPPAVFDPHDLAPSPVPMAKIYADRWMFHGPAYQAMTDIGPVGPDAIAGSVVVSDTPGATLDNVGQVFGFWGFATLPHDSLGFPARLGAVRFYGPTPSVGTELRVQARITEITPATFGGTIEVLHNGALWCRIEGWQNRRFETDAVVLRLLRGPGRHGLAVLDAAGVAWTKERWRTTASRELLARRYLDEAALRAYLAVPPWQQRGWLLERLAAADAVRAWLWSKGAQDVFPIEVQVDALGEGRYKARTAHETELFVTVRAATTLAAATVQHGAPPPPPPEPLPEQAPEDP